MTDCNNARNKMNEYIDGLLSDGESIAFEEHISCCEKCHEEYDLLKALTADLSDSKASLPEGFEKRMHQAIVNEQFATKGEDKSKKIFPMYTRYARFATAAAAVLMFAVVGKYGVYDVYKDVVNESQMISEQYADDNAAQINEPDSSPVKESVLQADTALVISHVTENKVRSITPDKPVEEKKVPVQTAQTIEPANALFQEGKQTAAYSSEDAESENADVSTEPQDVAVTAEEPQEQQLEMLSRMLIEESYEADEKSTESVDSITDVTTAEQNSKTETTAEEEEETVETDTETEQKDNDKFITESAEAMEGAYISETETAVPTVVSVNKSGDGSMLVFKKYLYTFLDSSQIKEIGETITITVDIAEFNDVIEKIAKNEYVKSVTMGTIVNGTAIITIQ